MSLGGQPILVVDEALTAKTAQEQIDLLTRFQRLIHIAEDKVVIGVCYAHPLLPSRRPTDTAPHTVRMFRIGTIPVHTSLQQ